MKNWLPALGFAAIAFSSASAIAGSLPVRAPSPAPILATPFSWNGFYAGLHAGYGWTLGDVAGIHYLSDPAFLVGPVGRVEPEGFLGGAQAGYNLQYGNLVFGVEGDFSFTGRSETARGFIFNPSEIGEAHNGSPNYLIHTRENWFGSVRGRVGIAADRALFYFTGGVGFTDVRYSLRDSFIFLHPRFGFTGAGSGSAKATRAGWVAGGGVEYAFTDNFTARLEGLYYDVRKFRVQTTILLNDSAQFTQATQSHALARFGVNYKF
jgi:outer membrane immunogenic protein